MPCIVEGIVRPGEREGEGVLATHNRTLPAESPNEITGEKCRHPQGKTAGTGKIEKLIESYVVKCGQGSQWYIGHFETVKVRTRPLVILDKVVNFADKVTMR